MSTVCKSPRQCCNGVDTTGSADLYWISGLSFYLWKNYLSKGLFWNHHSRVWEPDIDRSDPHSSFLGKENYYHPFFKDEALRHREYKPIITWGLLNWKLACFILLFKKVMLILVLLTNFDYWLAFAVQFKNVSQPRKQRGAFTLQSEIKLLYCCLHKTKKIWPSFRINHPFSFPLPALWG